MVNYDNEEIIYVPMAVSNDNSFQVMFTANVKRVNLSVNNAVFFVSDLDISIYEMRGECQTLSGKIYDGSPGIAARYCLHFPNSVLFIAHLDTS